MNSNNNKQPFKFSKEKILPNSNPRSPFYSNLPPHDSKPIDTLIEFFKFWKYFIKSIIYYFKEILLVKELEANLNYQLINAVQFPGCKDLPQRILHDINIGIQKSNTTPTKEMRKTLSGTSLSSMNSNATAIGGAGAGNNSNSGAGAGAGGNGITPMNSHNIPSGPITGASANGQRLMAAAGNTSGAAGNPGGGLEKGQRPGLFKTKSSSNQSFLKKNATNLHKRNTSLSSLNPLPHLANGQHHTHQQLQYQQYQQTQGGASTPPLITSQNTNDVQIPQHMFPENSLFTSLPALLLSSHHTAYTKNSKLHKDLATKLIPRLEVLLKQVSHKIKEIKNSLRNDSFANTDLSKEISQTGQVLSRYMTSIEIYCGSKPVIKDIKTEDENGTPIVEDGEFAALDDPLLLKLKVDSRLKTQLVFENYMFASYLNLQNISRDLFTYLLKELNLVVDKFGKLDLNTEFYQFLKTKISTSSTKDWEYFISHNPAFVNPYGETEFNPHRESRNFKVVDLPYAQSVQNKCIRFGTMYKKSKLMKSYTRNYYVLSCNYLHEFRFDNEVSTKKQNNSAKKEKIGGFIGYEDEPEKSYNLNDYAITVKDEGSFKFIMTKKSTKSKRTFKCLNEADFRSWFDDLSELLKFGSDHYARFAYIERKAMQNNGAGAGYGSGSGLSGAKLKKKVTDPELSSNSSTASSIAAAKGLKLQLDANNASVPALSGMFTPKIRTPQDSPSLNPSEINPFDDILNGIPNNGSTASFATSTRSSPSTTPKILSPNGSMVNFPIVSTNDGIGNKNSVNSVSHDDYLKLQQAFIKQQEEIMSLKTVEQANIEVIRSQLQSLQHTEKDHLAEDGHHSEGTGVGAGTGANGNAHAHGSGSGNDGNGNGGLMVNKGSSNSLNSFVLQPNDVSVAQAAIDNLQNRDPEGGVTFNLGGGGEAYQVASGEGSENVSGLSSGQGSAEGSRRDIPTVFVSSGH